MVKILIVTDADYIPPENRTSGDEYGWHNLKCRAYCELLEADIVILDACDSPKVLKSKNGVRVDNLICKMVRADYSVKNK